MSRDANAMQAITNAHRRTTFFRSMQDELAMWCLVLRLVLLSEKAAVDKP